MTFKFDQLNCSIIILEVDKQVVCCSMYIDKRVVLRHVKVCKTVLHTSLLINLHVLICYINLHLGIPRTGVN